MVWLDVAAKLVTGLVIATADDREPVGGGAHCYECTNIRDRAPLSGVDDRITWTVSCPGDEIDHLHSGS